MHKMTLCPYVLPPKLFALSPKALTTPFPVRSTQQAFHKVLACRPASVSASDDVFTWDDVVRISKPETLPDDPSDLKGYSEKIKICNCPFLDKLYNTFSPLPNRNRPIVRLSEFLCFVIEDQIVGYIHKGKFKPQWRFNNLAFIVEDRTRAVGDVIKSLKLRGRTYSRYKE